VVRLVFASRAASRRASGWIAARIWSSSPADARRISRLGGHQPRGRVVAIRERHPASDLGLDLVAQLLGTPGHSATGEVILERRQGAGGVATTGFAGGHRRERPCWQGGELDAAEGAEQVVMNPARRGAEGGMAPDRLPGDGAQDRTIALRHRHLDAPTEGVVGVMAWRLGREVGIEHGLEGDPFGPALCQRRPQRPANDPPLAERHGIHRPHGVDVLGDPHRHAGGAQLLDKAADDVDHGAILAAGRPTRRPERSRPPADVAGPRQVTPRP
jgi:hypothetical protein